MRDPDQISRQLENASDKGHARKRGKQVRSLRGLRGVPAASLVKVLLDAWRSGEPKLPRDSELLQVLFSTAFEDGLVAIGLLATVATEQADEAIELALQWQSMLDDVETADALGWLVIGPAMLATTGPVPDELVDMRHERLPSRRRVALAAAMAGLPVPLEGPTPAALREKMGERRLAFVQEPLLDFIKPVASAFRKDEDPSVRKALVRLVKAWAISDPDGVERWLDNWSGGSPKLVRAELEKAIKKSRRKAAQQAAWEAAQAGAEGEE